MGVGGGYERSLDRQSAGQILGGGLSDGIGLSGVYGGWNNRDIATGNNLNLGWGGRAPYIAGGALQLAPILYVSGKGVYRGIGKLVSVPRTTLAAAEEGAAGSLLPASSLSRRQAAIMSSLPEQGTTGWFSKSGVSMADLRAVGRVTGDEFSMYTVGGRRFIIRGFGNKVRVTAEVADEIAAGRYGRWSGHTHPPGYRMVPTDGIDRPWLARLGQGQSGIWADDGIYVFGQTGATDMGSVADITARREMARLRSFYAGQE